MGGGMFNFRNTVSTGQGGQADDGDPGDLMGLPDFVGTPAEGPIAFEETTTDPMDQVPGDFLGEQIFKV